MKIRAPKTIADGLFPAFNVHLGVQIDILESDLVRFPRLPC